MKTQDPTNLTAVLAALVLGITCLPAALRAQTTPPAAEPGVAKPAPARRGDSPELIAAAVAALPPVPEGPMEPTWDSIKANYQTPDWFRDAKFGIMMHWGVYSVPAHGSEWYVRYMYDAKNKGFVKWHTENYGPPDKFGYKDFIPLFKAEKWDPDAWANLFKQAARATSSPAESITTDSPTGTARSTNTTPKTWVRSAISWVI